MGRAPALILLLAAGCHDAPGGGDAGPDGSDPDNYPFTGHFLDWDATAAAPCPIVGATWFAHNDDTRVTMTDSSGAFTLELTSYYPLLDVVPPPAPSACTNPPSSYTIPGIAIAPPAFVFAGGAFSARSLTSARAATFYAGFGSAFDATRANVLVHVDGAQRELAVSSAHDAVQAFSGTAWAPGATGVDVFFPNIDPTGDMTTVTVAGGGGIGFGSVPIAAGSITYMSVIVN